MLQACHWIETTTIGTLVRESLYGFPILVTLHVLGLTLSVGTLLWFDLRLLGVALQGYAALRVYRRLIPWATAGFAIMILTGALLFCGYASAAYQNGFFRLKVASLILAAGNAAFYHVVTERSRASWDTDRRPPAAARAAGLISLVLWGTVIVCGRLMSYTMY
jgi:hypothetical protein